MKINNVTITMNEADTGLPGLREYVRTQMRSLGLRQKDLAQATGVTESYVSQVLSGKTQPSDRFLRKLEAALELKQGKLFLLIGRPELGFVRSFLVAEVMPDELSSITDDEKTALIDYLRFLRLREGIEALNDLSRA